MMGSIYITFSFFVVFFLVKVTKWCCNFCGLVVYCRAQKIVKCEATGWILGILLLTHLVNSVKVGLYNIKKSSYSCWILQWSYLNCYRGIVKDFLLDQNKEKLNALDLFTQADFLFNIEYGVLITMTCKPLNPGTRNIISYCINIKHVIIIRKMGKGANQSVLVGTVFKAMHFIFLWLYVVFVCIWGSRLKRGLITLLLDNWVCFQVSL